MKISKSKRQLAQLLIEAGVKQFPDGANWAAQDKREHFVTFYKVKPRRDTGSDFYAVANGSCWSVTSSDFEADTLITNWHQTKLSRDEFDQIVAEIVGDAVLDADGWIEWSGVPRSPVSKGTQVDVKMQNGTQHFGQLIDDECWSDCWGDASIIAYRLRKPEQAKPEFCESVMRSIPEPEAKPTIDQLLQDWRNADDLAKRKQAEADEAAAMRDERWGAVQVRAGEMGVAVGLCESVAAEPEQVNPVKPVMTGKFRNAKIGSPKHYISNKGWSDEICDECGKSFGEHFDTDCNP